MARKTLYYVLAFVFLLSAVIIISGSKNDLAAQDKAGMDKAAIEQIVRDYILANPEVIVDAMDNLRAKQRQAEAAKFGEKFSEYKTSLTDPDASPYAGDKNGDITVVEFFDYNCGYCKKALSDVQKIIENNNDVTFIFKEMPILSASSRLAAEWALAVYKVDPDKYFEYHVKLMSHAGQKDVKKLAEIAEEVGLDADAVREKANDPAVKAEIEENLRIARELGITGTPAFIIGDQLNPGYMGLERMQQMIEAARDNQG